MALEQIDENSAAQSGGDINTRWIKITFIVIALFYVLTVFAKWWPTPDSSLYLGLAKSMISGDGYKFNGETSTTVTPGYPVILGGIMKIFGENYYVLNMFSALCALAALGLAYKVIRNMTNSRRLALAVLLCTAMSYDYYRLSRMILTDTVFCAIFWMMMFCVLKFRDKSWWWLILAAVLATIGLTVRIPCVLIMLPLAVSLLICWPWKGSGSASRHWATSILLLAISFGTAGAFYLLAKSVAPQKTTYAGVIKGDGAAGKIKSVGLKFIDGMAELPQTLTDMTISQKSAAVGIIVLILVLTGSVVAWRKSLGFLAIFWWLSVFAFAAVNGAVAVRTRYMLALFPIFFLLTIWGTQWWYQAILAWAKKPLPDAKKLAAVTTIFVIIIGGFNLPRVLKLSVMNTVKSYGDNYYGYLRKGEFADLMHVSQMLRELDADSQIYSADTSRMHYLSGKVLKRLPSHNIATENELDKTMAFLDNPATAGYLIINMKEPLAGKVTKKLDADTKNKLLFSGKYLRMYKRYSDSRKQP